jgi:hypothetical protein
MMRTIGGLVDSRIGENPISREERPLKNSHPAHEFTRL